MTTRTGPDPILFELFKNTLFGIADEMALTIFRTAYSGVLKDVMDYSTAFCDEDGKTVAQGLTLPAHLCSVPDAMAAIIRRYGDRMSPKTRTGTRTFFSISRKSVSFGSPASYIFTGGMRRPSWYVSVESDAFEPATRPPMSVWWQTVAAKASRSPL